MSQPGLWWGVPIGTIIGGTVGPYITARSLRASDKRKADQEIKMDDRKAEREDLKEDRKALQDRAHGYVDVCSVVLEKAMDNRAIFNAIRDAAITAGRMPDPMEMEKIEYSVDLMDETKRLTGAYSSLRLAASGAVLEKASALNAAIIAVTGATTFPLAKPPLLKQAAAALDEFVNAVRAELGKDAYTEEDVRRANMTFTTALQSQIEAYVKDAQEAALKLGFLDPTAMSSDPDARDGVSPGGMPDIEDVTAGELSESHVGKHVAISDPSLGVFYGAEIVEVKREGNSSEPTVILTMIHPEIPGAVPERTARVRLRLDQRVPLLNLPAAE